MEAQDMPIPDLLAIVTMSLVILISIPFGLIVIIMLLLVESICKISTYSNNKNPKHIA